MLVRKKPSCRRKRSPPAAAPPSKSGKALRQRPPPRPALPGGLREAVFGMGCFWGAERCSGDPRRLLDAVGYAGGYTPNATYEEVCTGSTGHTEVVKVIYDRRRSTTKTC